MSTKSSPGADIALAVALIAVALVVIYGTLDLPPGSFEPLGSASIPQYVSGGVIFFSLWLIVTALRRMRDDRTGRTSPPFRPRNDLAFGLMVLAVVYVAVMAMDWARFSIATAVFLLAAVGVLTTFRRRLLPFVVGIALVLGFGLEYVFTQVFVIDLP